MTHNTGDLVRARLELRLLGEEAAAFSDRVNARIEEIVNSFPPGEPFMGGIPAQVLEAVPTHGRLIEIQECGDSLTQGPMRHLPSQQRAHLAAARCAVADAVAHARRGNFSAAIAASKRAHVGVQKVLLSAQTRGSTDALEALSEAIAALGAIVASFMGAEAALAGIS